MADDKPVIVDPPAPPGKPLAKPDDKPEPSPELLKVIGLIEDLRTSAGSNAGLPAMLAKAGEIDGKLTKVVAYIEANPTASLPEALDQFRKMLVESPATKDAATGNTSPGLANRIFNGITLGAFAPKPKVDKKDE